MAPRPIVGVRGAAGVAGEHDRRRSRCSIPAPPRPSCDVGLVHDGGVDRPPALQDVTVPPGREVTVVVVGGRKPSNARRGVDVDSDAARLRAAIDRRGRRGGRAQSASWSAESRPRLGPLAVLFDRAHDRLEDLHRVGVEVVAGEEQDPRADVDRRRDDQERDPQVPHVGERADDDRRGGRAEQDRHEVERAEARRRAGARVPRRPCPRAARGSPS